ncbi:Retrovirus-related Pol polyprotein from transposon TNT 1-94 [Sesbania bispinosa]|nr:Retrovirus-related Pol polyprotein from transposon TNT 1-94 [Sesbania bispinosa]
MNNNLKLSWDDSEDNNELMPETVPCNENNVQEVAAGRNRPARTVRAPARLSDYEISVDSAVTTRGELIGETKDENDLVHLALYAEFILDYLVDAHDGTTSPSRRSAALRPLPSQCAHLALTLPSPSFGDVIDPSRSRRQLVVVAVQDE